MGTIEQRLERLERSLQSQVDDRLYLVQRDEGESDEEARRRAGVLEAAKQVVFVCWQDWEI